MRLRPAPGSPDMRKALSNQYVLEIVTILHEVVDKEFFRDVALFLRTYTSSSQKFLKNSLDDLRNSDFPDEDASFVSSDYVNKLINMLEALYQYDDKYLGFLRGAIVEKLAFRLISNRCIKGECFSNYYFEDMRGRRVTAQIDVAVLSRSIEDTYFAEGYECKMSPEGVKSEDCDNLWALIKTALDEEYYVHAGVVSFENDLYIERRLKYLEASRYIKGYGLDSLIELENLPEYIGPANSIN